MISDSYGHTSSTGGNMSRKYNRKILNKTQFQLINKYVFAALDEVFEALVGIADDLTIDNDVYIRLV